ncbi:MAG: (Fe-S)-binding protein [Candidatus Bathyarchaeota archaeon]
MSKLPMLDCAHCGFSTCAELAEAISNGAAVIKACWVLNQEEKVALKINRKNVPLSPFVQDIIRKTVLGMLSSLKHVGMKGEEHLLIVVQKPKKAR